MYMRSSEYLIVHKSILPQYFEQVIIVRELINNQKINICEACKMQNISRSTYYKYKDFIFRPTKDNGNRALFAIKTIDEKGILSSILQVIYDNNGNVISINQEAPIDKSAYITIMIDIGDLKIDIESLQKLIALCYGVKSIAIMGVE